MKKLILTAMMLAAVSFQMAAQDTIGTNVLRNMGNYFFQSSLPAEGYKYGIGTEMGTMSGGEYAKYFYSRDSLTIYGIAASVVAMNYERILVSQSYYDTTDTNVYEFLRLYKPQPDSLLWERQAKVHPNYTQIAYYLTVDKINNTQHTTPMYERYFIPATVKDSFYVGITDWCRLPYVDSNGHQWEFRNRALGLVVLGLMNVGENAERLCLCFHNAGAGFPPHFWSYVTEEQRYSLIFPILTPNPDTTDIADTNSVNDTTLGVTEQRLVDRYTGILPNPAAEKARVVSSFGLTLVEAFSSSGAPVYSQPADGLYLDLDISRWPSGTYLLRIHTPLGIATKKLIKK